MKFLCRSSNYKRIASWI